MSDNLTARLRAADPAHGAGLLTEEQRARLLAASVARRHAPTPVPSRPKRRAPRRTLLLAAVVGLICAAGAAAGVVLSGQSGHEVRDHYAEVTRQVPLPPGYRWPGADAPDTVDGVRVVYAGHNAALMQATLQATCAWWDAWLRARARGDAAGMRAALAGHARVMALTPRHRPGDSEDAGGADASVFALERKLVGEAQAGRVDGVRARQAANCTGAAAPRFAGSQQ